MTISAMHDVQGVGTVFWGQKEAAAGSQLQQRLLVQPP
jgi:hypothetical protein